MSILALDQADLTGWALVELDPPGGDFIRFGTWDFGAYPWLGRKLLVLEGKMVRVVKAQEKRGDPITHIACETPFVDQYTAQATARQLMSLTGMIEKVAVEHRLQLREYTSPVWRKTFIGIGRANKKRGQSRAILKQMTVDRCRRLGHAVKDDNQADAIGILHHAVLDIFGRQIAALDGPLFEGAA